MTNWPLVGYRFIGPGVGDHASPDSSSRMNNASAVGSTFGSLANDVSRFSRLFSLHVVAEPDAVTMVANGVSPFLGAFPPPGGGGPGRVAVVAKGGLAMALAPGRGVFPTPPHPIPLPRPPSGNPPAPFDSVISAGAAAGARSVDDAGG